MDTPVCMADKVSIEAPSANDDFRMLQVALYTCPKGHVDTHSVKCGQYFGFIGWAKVVLLQEVGIGVIEPLF